jgi:hypothetical protein
VQAPPSPSPSAGTAVADRSTQFVSTEGGDETTSAELLLVVAYLLMWLLVLGFVALSFRRLRRLTERLDALEKPHSEGGREGAEPS